MNDETCLKHLLAPDAEYSQEIIADAPRNAIIACGALAHEILHLIRLNNLKNLQLFCLPANLHLQPQKIVPRLETKIVELRGKGFEKIYLGYGDCGTVGAIDKLMQREGLERITGEHCYEFFAGTGRYLELVEQELRSFYLTDYLARFFETLIIKGFKIDKHPELQEMMFGEYKKIVYLAQTENPELDRLAEAAAKRLGLEYERVQVGYGFLEGFIKTAN